MYRENAWLKYDQKELKNVMKFADGYKEFLSISKTERLATKEAVKQLEAAGFKCAKEVKSLKAGDKIYFVNKNKNVCAFIIGKKPLEEGLRILGAHIDSPRLDLKEHPLYEKNGFALGDTHYYGGVKKYQWTTIPLALHGVICKKDGSVVDPFDGTGDIKRRLIRTVGNPHERFMEDGLRPVRCVRFACKLGFSIEKYTYSEIFKEDIQKKVRDRVELQFKAYKSLL